MSKLNKALISIGCVLLLFIGIIESNLPIKRLTIDWDPDSPVKVSDFRGYPNINFNYGGAIASYFVYDILGDTYDSVDVRTLMLTHHSWIRDKDSFSDYGLRHEQYHFNMSEVYARKFKQVLHRMGNGKIDKKNLKDLYSNHLTQLNFAQDQYDVECDHGLILERQKDWEYKIDSSLNDLAYYSTTVDQMSTDYQGKSHYYRGVHVDGKHNISGLHKIDPDLAQRIPHYAFQYNGDQLVEVAYFKKGELAIDNYIGAAVTKISYHGNLEQWRFFNPEGKAMQNVFRVYGQNMEREHSSMIVTNVNEYGQAMLDDEGVCKIDWRLDRHGRRTTGFQYNTKGERVIDNKGINVVALKYDRNGNRIEQANYNDEFELINDHDGVAFQRYFFDEMDQYISAQIYDNKHSLIDGANYVGASVYTNYDLDGNLIRLNYKYANGRPVLGTDGRAISYYSYDPFGNRTVERHYGRNRNLIINGDRHGQIQRDYDSLSRVVEMRNYDAYDKYLNDLENRCKTVYRYNPDSLVSEKDYFTVDSAGKLAHLKTIIYTYNDNDQIIEEKYFDENGDLRADSTGVCIKRFNYDGKNNLVEISHYNANDELESFTGNAVRIKFRYNDRNQKIESAYFDVNDHLTENEEGIARELNTYNPMDLRTSVSYFDADNKPTTYDKGAEHIKWLYNRKMRIAREAYYNGKGELRENSDGISMMDYEYNNSGLVSRVSFKDKHGSLADCHDGYAIEIMVYDLKQRLARVEYLSRFKQAVLTSGGYACIEYMYDKSDNTIATICRNETRSLIEDKHGWAIYNYIHNRNGEVTAEYRYKAEDRFLDSIDKGPFAPGKIVFHQNLIHQTTFDSRTNLRTTYYDNGQKQSEGTYINGQLEGMYYTWYEDGQLSSEVTYANGKRNGLSIDYYKNGVKWREVNYIDNVMEYQSEVSWHMNGRIRSRYIDGKEVDWDEEGNRISQ